MPPVSLRKLLGARLLTERIQVKNWNELRAATEAGIEPKTVRRIERGLNYQIEKLEKYALALGRPLEDWLREILMPGPSRMEPTSAGAPSEHTER